MRRTVVYPPRDAARAAVESPDKVGDKLVKYIPAEVIAFYVPVYAYVQARPDWAKWLVLGLAVVGTLGYLYVRSEKANPPRWFFYVLAVLAFIGWALGTSSLGADLFGFPDFVSKLAVFLAVFLLPLVDQFLTRIRA
jgi:hypothetical protein